MAIQQALKKLDLNDKEIKVYLAVLKHGKIKPSVLAKMTKINRATLYNVARSLISKGIIAEDITGKILHFSPFPPSKLSNILTQTKKELQEKEVLVKDAIKDLSLIAADKFYPVPKIRFVEENDLEKYLFDNTEKWQDSIIDSDGIWWGYQDRSFAELFEKWIDYTWTTKQSRHPHYKPQVFTNETAVEKRLSSRYSKDIREMKVVRDTNFTANTWVCGNYLVSIVTHQQPFYLIEIHDQMIAHNTKEIFAKLWKSVT